MQKKDQLEKCGLDPSLVDQYDAQSRSIVNMPKHSIEFLCPIADLNIDKFKSAVDAFTEEVRVASPTIDTD